ncbi:MAG: hypothetical protein DME16_10950 [Candidatus Rokuibacteriota bacterium]|nr:MAG: hypothetical protein DME16_10950 [Candidatus Rokubacteria bacterium]
MRVVARRLTLEEDGIPGYVAHPEGGGPRPGVMMVHHAHGVTADYKIDAYQLATLGFNVLVPSLFNMFGVPGTNHIGQGADLPQVRAIVLYYPSVRDEPETSHRPRHAFALARTLRCASLVFCAGKDYIATPAIQGPLWQSFTANGQLVEWHFFSDANHGFRHPDNDGYQPHYADLAWPLVTSFLERTV